MHEAYIRGFLAKCAEAGVDPQVLLKPTEQPIGAGPGAPPPPVLDGAQASALLPGGGQIEPPRRGRRRPPLTNRQI